MLVYSYLKIRNCYQPIISISIKNLATLENNITESGILDTGSEITLVPLTIIFKLNILRLQGQKAEYFSGVGNKDILGIPYQINLSLDSKIFFKTKIYGCSEDDTGGIIIIGLNILNRFSITFDGINKQIIINP